MLFTEKEINKLRSLFEAYFSKPATYREIGETARDMLLLFDRIERRILKRAERNNKKSSKKRHE